MHEELIERLKNADKHLSDIGLGINDSKFNTRNAIADAISALTAPQAETCERDAVLEEAALQAERTKAPFTALCIRALKSDPTWTRKDGSTTPRGDVVDRRKSAEGYERIYARRNLGRRSGDAARWTAPVQETPQTLEEAWCRRIGMQGVDSQELDLWALATNSREVRGAFVWLLRELDRRSAMK